MYGSGLTGTGSNGADTLSAAADPTRWSASAVMISITSTTAADVVTEATNGGYDTVMAYVSYTLSANVEAMYMTGSGLTGTGNSSANTLNTSHTGANTLVGGGGNDTFEFFAGSANGATVADFDAKRGGCPGVQRLRHRGAGRDLHARSARTDQWQIHSGLDPHNETITFSNHAALHAGDFFFV